MLQDNIAGGHAVGNTTLRSFPLPGSGQATQATPNQMGPQIAGDSTAQPQGGGLFPLGMETQRFQSGEGANPQEQQEIDQAVQMARGAVENPNTLKRLHKIMQSNQGEDVTEDLAMFATALLEKMFMDMERGGGMSSAQWLTAVLAVIGSMSQSLMQMGAQLQPDQIKQFARRTMMHVGKITVQNGWASQEQVAQLGQLMSGGASQGMGGTSGQPMAGPGSTPPGHEMAFGGGGEQNMMPQSQGNSGAVPKKRTRRRGSRGGSGKGSGGF